MRRYITYEKEEHHLNNETGEISEKKRTRIIRVENKNSEKFFKIFVENLAPLYSLKTSSSVKLLFWILNNATNRNNLVSLNANVRSDASKELNMHRVMVSRSIKELREKELFLPVVDRKNAFVLNPYIFGQGSFIDVEKLRQTIEREYDFKEGIITETIGAVAITNLGQRVLDNPSNFEVKQALSYKESDNHLRAEVVLREKEESREEQLEIEADLDEEQKLQKVIEKKEEVENEMKELNILENSLINKLEILKEQNRAKELELEILKEQNRAKELELKMKFGITCENFDILK